MTVWPSKSLADLCTPIHRRDPRNDPEAPFRYIDISSIDRDAKRVTDVQVLAGVDAPTRARQVIRTDDVLVSTVRPNLNAVAIVPPKLDRAVASTGFCVLRARKKLVLPHYLFFYARSPAFIEALTANTRGASYPAVSDGDVRRQMVPVPSPGEQRRIVEILDQAHRLCDLRARANAKADRVLPALLARVLGTSANWHTDPYCEPLGEFATPVSGATPPKRVEAFWQGGVPWVSPKDMKVEFLSDSQDHVSEAAVQETNLNIIEQGSALVVVRGMILARSVPLAINLTAVTINQDMKALVPRTEETTGTYLWAALTAAKSQLKTLVRTAGHGTRKLDTPDLMEFRIPRPDPDQIRQVSSVVETHRQLVERRRESELSLNRLFTLLLTKAFDGSLTAAWREAHAAALLEDSPDRHLAGPMEGVV